MFELLFRFLRLLVNFWNLPDVRGRIRVKPSLPTVAFKRAAIALHTSSRLLSRKMFHAWTASPYVAKQGVWAWNQRLTQ